MKILIVDDDPKARAMLRGMLVAAEHEVVEAGDGIEALSLLKHQRVEAVVSDILMPRMDGFAPCRRIRGDERLKNLPHIFYTRVYVSRDDEARARAAGTDFFLVSPAPHDVLLKALQSATMAPGSRPVRAERGPTELGMMQEYDATLVRQLGEKNAELAASVKQLLRAEDTLRLQSAALANAADSIVITDVRGTILWANPAFAEMTGYSLTEAVGRNPRLLKSGRHDRAYYHELWQTILAGRTWRGEFTNRRKDGSLYQGEQAIAPVRNEAGAITHFVGVMNDITARRQAEAELRASERRYREIFERSLEGLYQTTPEGHFLSANSALARILGYSSADELIARHTHRPGEAGPDQPESFKTLMAEQGFVTDFEYQIRRKEGGVIWVSENVRAVRAADGSVLCFEGSLIDITERKRAAAEKTRLARQMELLLESTGEGICGLDGDGRCTFINRAGARMIGREPAAVLGKEMHRLMQHQRADGRDYSAAENPILSALRRGEHCEVNTDVFWRADGTSFPVEYRSNPIREGDTILGAVVMFTDITEKKKLEAELLRTQRIESVGRLASGIAHDMNNILAPIMMSAPLLRMPLSPDDVEKTLATIETSAKRGADLVKQLLTFGRGVEGDRGPIDLDALIREIMRIAAQTFPRNISFVTQLAPDAGSVSGDGSQLHQVLLNLFVNARDAMPQGGTLTVATASVDIPAGGIELPGDASPGHYVKVSVSDTGTGIPPEIVDKVFDPFFTTKDASRGTGLGLSTLLGVVKSHGGFVRLSSEVNRGSTFDIYLPAIPHAKITRSAQAEAPPPQGGNELILVVDDEASIRTVLRETLAHRGYRVITANDGAEACAVFARNQALVALVIADLDMPFLDGLGLVKVLREMKPDVKVLISTGAGATKALQERLEELRMLRVDSVLNKPYGSAQILSAVSAALAAKKGNNPPVQAAVSRL